MVSGTGFSEIYRGASGMECPICGVLVLYAAAAVPLTLCPPGSSVARPRRDVIKAATWASVSSNGMTLEKYLVTTAGQLYAQHWTQAEVRQADQQVAAQP